MLSATLLASALSLSACKAPPAPAAAPIDAEGVAVTWLRDQVFDDNARQAPRFVPGVDPAAFPPRLMVDRIDEYKYLDLWRLRVVDGQVLVEALVEIAGAPHIQGLRLKAHEGGWRIAGWVGSPRPAATDQASAAADLALPDDLAAMALRGSRASAVLPVEAPLAVDPADEAPAKVKVALALAAVEGDCDDRRRLKQTLEAATKPLAACGTSISGRGGRFTFAVVFEGGSARPAVELQETTLLDGTVAACAKAAFEALPASVAPGATCTATVRVTLRPLDAP
jgi:hypothetical protein